MDTLRTWTVTYHQNEVHGGIVHSEGPLTAYVQAATVQEAIQKLQDHVCVEPEFVVARIAQTRTPTIYVTSVVMQASGVFLP